MGAGAAARCTDVVLAAALTDGAGRMLVPVLAWLPQATALVAHAAQPERTAHAQPIIAADASVALPRSDLAAVAVHTGAVIVAMGLIAIVGFEKLGLSVVRRAWFNFDSLWAGALIATSVRSFVV